MAKRFKIGESVRVCAGFKFGRIARVEAYSPTGLVAVDFCDGRPQEWYDERELSSLDSEK